MFAHIFINRLKCLVRDKEMVFWTLLFPIVLGTLFNLAFSNLSAYEDFNTIHIAVVDDAQYKEDTAFSGAIASVSKEQNGEKPLFNVTKATREQADALLKDNKIEGYIYLENGIRLTVKQNGLSQTIIKGFLDDYAQISSAVGNIIKSNPLALQNGILEKVAIRKDYLKEVSASNAKPDTTLNYFYTLIAMTCLYGSFFGLKEMRDIQADMSGVAARVGLSPVHKLKVYLYRQAAAILLHFSETLVVLAYVRFGLHINFGSQTAYVIFACFIGCITGIAFGSFVGAVVKKDEAMKTAVLISVTMTLCFLAGMMFVDMKYIVASSAPILGYLNPANLLTDAFYSLYYYDTHTRFFMNIALLIGFTVVFSTITYFTVRRQKYASL